MSDQSPVVTKSTLPFPAVPPAVVSEKQKRGFAVMDRTQVREFARRGGVAAHREGKAHQFTSDEARAAGRKGGMASAGRNPSKAREEGDVTTEKPISRELIV
jgi:general stress protein YciG